MEEILSTKEDKYLEKQYLGFIPIKTFFQLGEDGHWEQIQDQELIKNLMKEHGR